MSHEKPIIDVEGRAPWWINREWIEDWPVFKPVRQIRERSVLFSRLRDSPPESSRLCFSEVQIQSPVVSNGIGFLSYMEKRVYEVVVTYNEVNIFFFQACDGWVLGWFRRGFFEKAACAESLFKLRLIVSKPICVLFDLKVRPDSSIRTCYSHETLTNLDVWVFTLPES